MRRVLVHALGGGSNGKVGSERLSADGNHMKKRRKMSEDVDVMVGDGLQTSISCGHLSVLVELDAFLPKPLRRLLHDFYTNMLADLKFKYEF